MRRLPFVVLAMAFAAAITTTCDTLDLGEGHLEELERNRELWERVAPASYVYAVERRCFCPEGWRGPVRVSVEAGRVTERVYTSDGAQVPSEVEAEFPAVEGLFEVLEDAVRRDAHSIDVSYDPETGVPIDFWIDYYENAADEELGYTVVESVARPPTF